MKRTKRERRQVRISPDLLARADALIAEGTDGLTTQSKFADAAYAHFLAVKEEQRERRIAFKTWEEGGRKGPPPWTEKR